MSRTGSTMGVLLLVGVVGLSSGCATRAMEAAPAPTASKAATPESKPSETEIAIACGAGWVMELAAEGHHATRDDALRLYLEDLQRRRDELDLSGIPNTLFIELMTAARQRLPEVEKGLRPDELVQIHVEKDGREFGLVELSPDFDERYGVTAIGLMPTDPALCEEHDKGDFPE